MSGINPYFQNWNYGYTLGPPTEETRGAYTTYPSSTQENRGAATASTPAKTETSSWGQVKSELGYSVPPPQPQHFVAASQTQVKNENSDQPLIGPKKPQAVVNPSQYNSPAASASLLKIHELASANRLVEKYETVKEDGCPGSANASVKVNLFLGTEVYQGEGPSIKIAKQIAAVQALTQTKYQTATEQKYSLSSGGKRPIGVTATSELHELATKKGVKIDFKFLEPYNFEFKHSMRMWSKDEMRGNYRVQLNVAGYEFYGQADLPQTAKHNAASQAMAIVRNLPDPSGSSTVLAAPPLPGQLKAKPTPTPAPQMVTVNYEGKNVNMALNEIAMMNGCVPEWTMISESGPPHQKVFTWQLQMGAQFTTTGTGPNKKVARQVAAEQMLAAIPEEWKQKQKKKGNKRTASASLKGGPSPKKKIEDDGKIVITADNPISCLFEYAKKVKIPDPEFSCIAENLLETWQKANQTFKKIEYTMQLKIDDKTYLASSNQKKAAKQACAAEAWNAIRATLL